MSKFRWKDYEEYSALFVDGITENIALLNKNTYQLKTTTKETTRIKADCLEEAKSKAEVEAVEIYRRQYKIISDIMAHI